MPNSVVITKADCINLNNGNNTFVKAKYLDEKESESTIKQLFIGNQN